MSNHDTDPHEPEVERVTEPAEGIGSRIKETVTTVAERSPDGSLSMLAGGALLAGAVRSKRRGRAVIQAMAGVGLLVRGLRKRQSREETMQADEAKTVEISETGTTEERAQSHQGDINPRDVDDEPDVETKTEPDEGTIQFSDEQTDESQAEPTLDDQPEDPRLDDDEDVTEVDISEAAMADETAEAAGPSTSQSEPAQTESTEPELSPDETDTESSDQSASEAEEGEESDDSNPDST